MSSCSENRVRVNDIDLCWFEWGARYRDQGTVLLVHATGFHARCWDQTVARLGERHVIALDQRGHGRSDNTPPFDWRTYGDDLTAFIKALELTNVIGVGHSMGGHALTQAAAAEEHRFKALVLVDAVILVPQAYENAATSSNTAEHPVSRRRNLFDSAEAMAENLAGRGGYAVWLPEVLRDYCEYGLLLNPEGNGFVLACPPFVEATIYSGSSGTDIYDDVERIQLPVTVLRAQQRESNHATMDFSKSPTSPGLADRFANATDVYLPELTHFIPMQAPQVVADHILKYSADSMTN